MISVQCGDFQVDECISLIVVPERGIEEHGYIQTISSEVDQNDKHSFHALSQMAYYQLQDDELDVHQVDAPIQMTIHKSEEVLNDGLVLLREKGGTIRALFTGAGERKKLIEAAFRFCTRWVRLDI